MPYFITDKSTECDAWAVIKDDGEVLACHADKQSAIDQMVAVSLAEDIQPGGERNLSGDPIAISDLDATLIWNGARDDRVTAYLKDFSVPIYIVTGRLEADRAKTTDELAKLGIEYDKLIMNDTDMDSIGYKTATAKTLLETFNIVVAIDDNRETLTAYRELGINALHPAGIEQTAERDKIENSDRAVNLTQKETRMETRHFNGTINGLEIRADGDGRTFRGYAAVFNADSEPMGGFTERIAPGAFRRSLTSHGWDIKLLANHDAGRVLGSTRAKTLKLTEDDRGLYVEATLPDNTDGNNIAESIRRGDIDAMSFGFSITPGGDSWSADGAIRTLTDVKLYEVSIVAWPAYTSTAGTTSVRALTAFAQRTDIDADKLKGAIDALTEVQQLTSEQAAMLREIIDQLEMQAEAEEELLDEQTDMVEESAQEPIDEMPLDVLLNQIQLKLKGITNGN
jgi:uncharacterized protein